MERTVYVKHLMTKTPEYQVWRNMLSRCYNAKSRMYPRYGGRGISVCDRWRTSFKYFIADVGRRPSSAHSIDRINNDGHYEPSNVRWSTKVEQQGNQAKTVKITFQGETLSARAWSRKTGIGKTTIISRIRADWPVEKALSPEKHAHYKPREKTA